jgi:hypothetical protein
MREAGREQQTTTTPLLLEHQTATTDAYGNYLVEVEGW